MNKKFLPTVQYSGTHSCEVKLRKGASNTSRTCRGTACCIPSKIFRQQTTARKTDQQLTIPRKTHQTIKTQITRYIIVRIITYLGIASEMLYRHFKKPRLGPFWSIGYRPEVKELYIVCIQIIGRRHRTMSAIVV